jgi:hypothetical protein
MSDKSIVDEIKALSAYFREAPYGQYRNGKYMPPNYMEYSLKVDSLINSLQLLKEKSDMVSINEIDVICSLRDNQLARGIADINKRRKEFEKKLCDDELLSISRSIDMVINKFVDNK